MITHKLSTTIGQVQTTSTCFKQDEGACQGCVGTLRPLCTLWLLWKAQQINGTMCFTNNEQS